MGCHVLRENHILREADGDRYDRGKSKHAHSLSIALWQRNHERRSGDEIKRCYVVDQLGGAHISWRQQIGQPQKSNIPTGTAAAQAASHPVPREYQVIRANGIPRTNVTAIHTSTVPQGM